MPVFACLLKPNPEIETVRLENPFTNSRVGGRPAAMIGHGGRDLDCPLYEDCLDLAAQKDWPAFHCEACPLAGSLFNPDLYRADPDEEDQLDAWEPWLTPQADDFCLFSMLFSQ